MRLLALVILVVLVVGSVWTWFNVPGFQDSHDPVIWFLLPAIATLMVVLMQVMARLVKTRPQWVNLPDKSRFRALTVERQRPVLTLVQSLMCWISLELVVLTSLLQLGIYEIESSGEFNIFFIIAIAFGMAGSPIVALVYFSRIQSEVTRQYREQGNTRNNN